MNNKISEKDKKTWNEFLSKNQKLPDKDNVQTEIQVKKTKTLDLHGKSLEEANQIIENFIKKSFEKMYDDNRDLKKSFPLFGYDTNQIIIIFTLYYWVILN